MRLNDTTNKIFLSMISMLWVSWLSDLTAHAEEDVHPCNGPCGPYLMIGAEKSEYPRTYIIPVFDVESLEASVLFARSTYQEVKDQLQENTPAQIQVLSAYNGPNFELSGQNLLAETILVEISVDSEARALSESIGLVPQFSRPAGPLVELAQAISEDWENVPIFQLEIPEGHVPSFKSAHLVDDRLAASIPSHGLALVAKDSDSADFKTEEQNRSRWQRLYDKVIRPYAARSHVMMTISVGLTSAGVTTYTMAIASGLPYHVTALVGLFAGSAAAGFHFWADAYYGWLGGDGWLTTHGKANSYTSAAKLTLKRAFVGFAYYGLYRMIAATIGVMPNQNFSDHIVKVFSSVGISLTSGYWWAQVLANLSREKGRPLPLGLDRALNVKTLSFLLSIAYDTAVAMMVVPQTAPYGRLTFGVLGFVGASFLAYQIIKLPKNLEDRLQQIGVSINKSSQCALLSWSVFFNSMHRNP